MRRLITILLLAALFIVPAMSSCVPGGYEGNNPNRPKEQQVDVEKLKQEQPGQQPTGGETTTPPATENTGG